MYFLRFVVAAFLAPVILCYNAEYDKLDTDKILADDALFTSYIDCFLDKAPCTAEYSSEIKIFIREKTGIGFMDKTPPRYLHKYMYRSDPNGFWICEAS